MPPIRPRRNAATSAPTPRRARIPRSAWRSGWRGEVVSVVMAGLVPAIHAFVRSSKDVDARDKPGYDGILKQTSLIDRFDNALRRGRFRLAGNGPGRTRHHRPVGIRGGADAAVGEFDRQMRAR